ncbi:hypothetical protein [Propionivibrio sp.]|uniref:hypothetical protein n=1 Tax=Propionivibrio sp. TaxID=2212460 RepID=UPI003BF07D9A
MKKNAGSKQLAVRVEDELLVAIDKKRLEMAHAQGTIPTRSDVVRAAIERFLSETPAVK